MNKIYAVLVAAVVAGPVASQARSVCEVEHGKNLYSDNTVRVSNYGHSFDEWNDCAKKSDVEVTEIKSEPTEQKAVAQSEALNKKLEAMDLANMNIQFSTGSSELSTDARAKVDQLTEVLKKNKNVKIRIAGHTDSTGSAALNKQLSKKRAEATAQELIKMGVAPEQLEVTGFGSEQPIATNKTADGRLKNRRISVEAL